MEEEVAIDELDAGIVRILPSDIATGGTGFVVSKDKDGGLIATCSHVVQKRESQERHEPRPNEVKLIFYIDIIGQAIGNPYQAKVMPDWWRPHNAGDMAILRLEKPLPDGVKPLLLDPSVPPEDHEFKTLGFTPVVYEEKGKIGRIIYREDKTAVLQLMNANIATRGFSGAPVLDTTTHRVVGMVSSIIKPDDYFKKVGIALAIPIETLMKVCPELKPSEILPYRSLEYFTEDDAKFFFGREELVNKLMEKLQSKRHFLAVFGPSGSGKSSLIRAGLIPQLRKGKILNSEHWEVKTIVIHQEENPFTQLELQGLSGGSQNLTQMVKEWLARYHALRLVLIIDQFEQLLVKGAEPLRQAFIEQLMQLLKESSPKSLPVTVVIVMRDDFYPILARQTQSLMNCVELNIINVPQTLKKEELTEIVRCPAEIVKLRFDNGLVEEIVDDAMKTAPLSEEDGQIGRSAILPLLEFTLYKLWEKDHKKGVLTRTTYRFIGGVKAGIKDTAEEEFKSLEKKGFGPLVRRIFTVDLVNPGEKNDERPTIKRRVSLNNIIKNESERTAVEDVVKHLADARLLMTGYDYKSKQRTVEIVHEALLKEWGDLKRWLKEDSVFMLWLKEIEGQSQEWIEWINTNPDPEQKDNGILLRGIKLESAEDWLQKRGADIKQDVKNFIHASRQHKEQEEKQWQKLYENEEKQRKLAERNAEETRSLLWATKAQQSEDTTLAIALALAANRIESPPALAQRVLAEVAYPPGIKCNLVFGHTGRVWSVAKNAGTVLSGSEDSSLILWDITTGKLIRRFEGHTGNVWGVALSADGSTALSGSSDRSLIVWDTKTGKIIWRFQEHRDTVWSVALSADGSTALSGSADKSLILWDIKAGKLIQRLEEHSDVVLSVALSADGQRALSGSADHSLILWDAKNGKRIHRFEGHKDIVLSVALSADGQRALSGSADRTLILWNTKTGEDLQHFKGHTGSVLSVTLSADGLTALSGSSDHRLILWDTTTGKIIQCFEGHSGAVNSVVLDADEPRALSSSDDRSLIVWDIEMPNPIRRMVGHTDIVRSVALSKSKKGLIALSGSADHNLILWNAETGELIHRLEGHSDVVLSVALSANGSIALSGGADNGLILWNTKTGSLIHRLDGHNGAIHSVALSADGYTALSGSADHNLILWDTKNGKLIHRLEGHKDIILSVALSADGHTALSCSADRSLIMWNTETAEPILRFGEESLPARSVALSADGRRALSVMENGSVIFWNTQTGKPIRSFEDGKFLVQNAALSADGCTALYSSDHGLILWNTKTEKVQPLGEHSGFVQSVALSADGRTALSSGDDFRLILWNTLRGNVLKCFEGHNGAVKSVVLSRNGQIALTGSDDTYLFSWDETPGKDNEKLIDFLKRNYSIDWVRNAKIEKIDDGKSIRVSTEKNSLYLRLINLVSINNKETRVNLKIDDGRTAKFIAKIENGKLNIYDNTNLIIWDVETGKPIQTSPWNPVNSVALSADGTLALAASNSRLPIFWNIKTGKIRLLSGHNEAVTSVALSADGRTALSGSDDHKLILWNTELCELIRRFKGHNDSVRSVALSSDGQTALSGSNDCSLILWDTKTGEVKRRFEGHKGSVLSVAFAPDRQTVASGSADKTVILWDIATGNRRTFTDHQADVTSVAFSADGKLILSASLDKSIILWDVESGQPVRRFKEHNDAILSLVCGVDPNGLIALSGSVDKTLILWRIHSHSELIAWIYANKLVHELTCEEREANRVEPFCDKLRNRPVTPPIPTFAPPVTSLTIGPTPTYSPPTPPIRPTLKTGESYFDAIQTGRSRIWQFDGQTGQVITVSVNAEGIYPVPYLKLCDTSNKLLAVDETPKEKRARIGPIKLLETGKYTVVVGGRDYPGGAYTILIVEEE